MTTYIQHLTKDGNPKEGGNYITNCGYLLYMIGAGWQMGVPDFWLEPVTPGMTLQECKRKVAEELHYTSWDAFEASIHFIKDWSIYIKYLDKVSELFAASQSEAKYKKVKPCTDFNDCKDQIAEEHEYDSWRLMDNHLIMEAASISQYSETIQIRLSDAVDRYLDSNTEGLRQENEKLKEEVELTKQVLKEVRVAMNLAQGDSVTVSVYTLKLNHAQLQQRADALAEALESIAQSPVPTNGLEVGVWIDTSRAIAINTLINYRKDNKQ